jgi:ribA/ribD-fused uncharacterized protein
MTINRFEGRNRFLSNFFPALVTYDGWQYRTVEHAYQAAKTTDLVLRRVIQSCETPRKMGRTVPLRRAWEAERVPIMLDLLRQKFSDPELGFMLRRTGDQRLVEGNYWHDNFWGECGCWRCQRTAVGARNMLGELLMQVRQEIPDRPREGPNARL